ncbi:MAG: LysR family transcriptional regulator [Pseudomonadota bacterium]
MNEKPYDWQDLQLFLAVAREGGLSPAAKATGSSPATLGRRMLALERAIGRDLFVRHRRGYELTHEGKGLQAALRQVESDILRAAVPVRSHDVPMVKISAGTWTTMTLLQNLTAITGQPADLRLRFVSDEAILDIPHREVAIGFRNARPEDVRLAGKKIMRVEFCGYATQDAPDRWIKVVGKTPSARWLQKTVGSDAVCDVNTPRNALDVALSGFGIALLPTFAGDLYPSLARRGSVVPELTHDQWIVTHQDDRHLPEVRRTIDRLTDLFSK